MLEESRTTQSGDISELTVNNTRSHSAQNRTHLANNPKQSLRACIADRRGSEESAFYDIFMHQCSKDAAHVLALSQALLSGTSGWLQEQVLVGGEVVIQLTMTRGARPTKSL